MFPNAGELIYIIHSIEFQKRGLPHVHILVKYSSHCLTAFDIDSVISAEMPADPEDQRLVQKFMMHHHPAEDQPPSRYCQRIENGFRICRFHYPKPLQSQTTIDTEGRVHYRRKTTDDQWIVPYCLPLLRAFQCHINFEACSTSLLFQYIFKYIHKGMQYNCSKLF